MIISDYYKGDTRIIIMDDFYCSEQEEHKRLKRIGEIATKALCSKGQKDKTT